MASGRNEPRLKGVADIVFVLDVSPSMDSIIKALATHVGSFGAMLLNDPQSNVTDVRLGLVLHGLNEKVKAFDFVTCAEEFLSNITCFEVQGHEFGLPAVDMALDYPWRDLCRRYIVFFSDQSLYPTGFAPDFQVARQQELCAKMASMHVHFVGFEEQPCPSYALLGKTPGSTFSVVDRHVLRGPGMQDVLDGVGKSISQARDQVASEDVQRNLYNLRECRTGNTTIRLKEE